jgi:hypothetical protein
MYVSSSTESHTITQPNQSITNSKIKQVKMYMVSSAIFHLKTSNMVVLIIIKNQSVASRQVLTRPEQYTGVSSVNGLQICTNDAF